MAPMKRDAVCQSNTLLQADGALAFHVSKLPDIYIKNTDI